jgi:two-component system sensor histidine kinase RegB
VLERAGEPFFTTKAPGQGMGLGLFLTRAVLARLGGNLELTSVPGGGTTAVLSLPVTTPVPLYAGPAVRAVAKG